MKPERDFLELIEEEHKKHTGTIDFSNVIFNIPVTLALKLKKICLTVFLTTKV